MLRTSSRYGLWICPKCHGEYSYPIKERKVGDDNCPYCNGRKSLAGYNTIETVIEDVEQLWSVSNEKPYFELMPSSIYYAKWQCNTCGGVYNEYVNSFVSKYLNGEDPCPYCSNKKPLAGFNTIETVITDADEIWSTSNDKHYSELLPNSTYFAEWQCNICGGIYSEQVNTFINKHLEGEDDCPYCRNRKVLSGYNSLKVRYQTLMSEWNYKANYLIVNPDYILPTYTDDVWWTCSCGKNYKMSPKKRVYYLKRQMKACPYCKGRRRKKYRHF